MTLKVETLDSIRIHVLDIFAMQLTEDGPSESKLTDFFNQSSEKLKTNKNWLERLFACFSLEFLLVPCVNFPCFDWLI